MTKIIPSGGGVTDPGGLIAAQRRLTGHKKSSSKIPPGKSRKHGKKAGRRK